MEAERLAGAAAFLDATVGLRADDPVRTNVLGSVATMHARGTPWQGECFWWVVRDGGRVVGMAMRTAPFVLSLSPMDPGAARALAAAVVAEDPDSSGVAGFALTVEAYLAASAALGGPGADDVSWTRDQLLYEARAVAVPPVPGEHRLATAAELETVLAWHHAFRDEVDGHQPGGDDELRHAVATSVADGRCALWWVDGAPVSLAGHAVRVDTPGGSVTRVGPVYTPPSLRRRGYAGAVTAAVTGAILAGGARAVLFTDAANPTSNHVYQQLGYEAVDRFVHHEFASREAPARP